MNEIISWSVNSYFIKVSSYFYSVLILEASIGCNDLLQEIKKLSLLVLQKPIRTSDLTWCIEKYSRVFAHYYRPLFFKPNPTFSVLFSYGIYKLTWT